MRKSKVLTKALAAILCIAMLIPMAVTVGAAETGSEPPGHHQRQHQAAVHDGSAGGGPVLQPGL